MIANLEALSGRPVIVGAGLAGLMTALRLAPQPVVVVSQAELGLESSTSWAQGGVAAALGRDDSVALHLDDTMKAGAGLCDEDAARAIVAEAPRAVEMLARAGARFDRDPDGSFALGLEAAHGRHRIAHARGDGTGREIMRALIEAVSNCPSITVLERTDVRRLEMVDGSVAGVTVVRDREPAFIASSCVVLATGGIGGLFADSTNPSGCFGQGLALAAQAGAVLRDLEFIQFHPTALDVGTRPMPLISEAVRGEGATLIDEAGERFLAHEPGAELAPRDIVARSIWRHIEQGHRVFLDARTAPGPDFAKRFPAIYEICRKAGYDPARQPIPVRPAAHYHMGGIAVDLSGRSSVPGLWACGEAASTGLHGANRLASNSLMEAVVLADRIACDIAGVQAERRTLLPTPNVPMRPAAQAIQPIMSRGLNVLREESVLRDCIASLLGLASEETPASMPASVALMIAVAALQRRESRGAHCRVDFPACDRQPSHTLLRLDEALAMAREFDRPTLVNEMA